MAKSKTPDILSANDLIGDLQTAMSKRATGAMYALGDHGQHTWGIKIPDIALQWLIGHSDILPAQRFFRASGFTKSLKSTLMVYLGVLHVQQGGIFIYDDNEGKTSSTMLDSMTWWKLTPEEMARAFMRSTKSAEEWQTLLTDFKKFNLKKLADRPKGQRVPTFFVIDSLMGKSGEAAQKELDKEGFAEERGYPVLAGQITRFMDAFSLLGTTMSVGYVQHLKPGTDGVVKEKGALQAGFSASVGLRATKYAGVQYAVHPLFNNGAKGPLVEGYPIRLQCDMSCLGPDNNDLVVEVLWQHVEIEGTKQTRQITKYNWAGALGELLYKHAYGDPRYASAEKKGRVYEFERKRLMEALKFTEGENKKCVDCKELGLENADLTTFGMAIEANPEVAARIQDYLNIRRYPSVQDAEIDWAAGKKGPKDDEDEKEK